MVDITIYQDQVGLMKMKIGELKTHLSKMVKEVNASQEPLEVCVREETVAYLVPVSKEAPKQIDSELEGKIKQSGLTITQVGRKKGKLPRPVKSKKGEYTANTVVRMREEKDW